MLLQKQIDFLNHLLIELKDQHSINNKEVLITLEEQHKMLLHLELQNQLLKKELFMAIESDRLGSSELPILLNLFKNN